MFNIVRCLSCEGYGWLDEEEGAQDCDWCGGVGYVYREPGGADRPIPESDFEARGAQLEQLEAERMRELGYTGEAKKPWEQAIRKRGEDESGQG